ncbi:unnamed protein product [Meloidogyne enterolobii]|uniref:Uncharacterized protein n=1 Tax=Meloidogyne enterolobii TaxID=390850 RepID=A0ACB0YXH9_MELEN
MNLFEEKAENKFKEESGISEKDLDIGLLEDFGKEQFCELDKELVCPLDGKQELASVEVPIRAECCVFHEISYEDILVSYKEIKEEIVCSESEECFDLEKVEEFVDLNEFGREECDLEELGKKDFDLKEIMEEKDDEQGILEFKLEVFEKDPEKEILPTRDKLEILEENQEFWQR